MDKRQINIPNLIKRLNWQIEEIKETIKKTKKEKDTLGTMGRIVMLKECIKRREECIDYLDNTYPPPFDSSIKKLEKMFGFKYYNYRVEIEKEKV
jgi:hypothetical protein